MWRNTDVVEFVEWCAVQRGASAGGARIGFYGSTLQSPASMEAVVQYLDTVDPSGQTGAGSLCLLRSLRRRRADLWLRGGSGMAKSCEDEVVSQLRELQRRGRVRAARWPDGGG